MGGAFESIMRGLVGVKAWESGRNVPSGAARRFLEVIRKERSLLLREKIVVYHSPAARARSVVKAAPIKLRASGARAVRGRSLKVELAR
jgi:hypothetical protein